MGDGIDIHHLAADRDSSTQLEGADQSPGSGVSSSNRNRERAVQLTEQDVAMCITAERVATGAVP